MNKVVYFARDPRDQSVKIGSTSFLRRRWSGLARLVPGLQLLVTTPGDRYVESAFHNLLIAHHRGREWFHPHPRVEAVVIALQEGWFDFDALPAGPSAIRSAASLRGYATRRERELAAA